MTTKDFKPMFFIEISHRALLGRLDRALRKDDQQVRADRRGGVVRHLLIDTKKRAVIEADVDLEKLARRLEILEPWERAARAAMDSAKSAKPAKPANPAKRGGKTPLARGASK
jgi:hypothetical protein